MYKTVLTGYTFIDDPCATTNYELNDTVVTMLDDIPQEPNLPGENTLLDGFTITDAAEYGIYGTDVDFTIANCTVTDSGQRGIYALNADVTVKWSKVNNNGLHGVDHEGAGNTIIFENSQIVNNKWHGIFSTNSTPTIKNCIVFGNGYFGEGFYGINITLPTEVPILYNNTIVYNAKEGVAWIDDTNSEGDPNFLDYPDIQNSILWYNNNGGAQVTGFEQDTYASYCDIEDCNKVNNNIKDAPGFVLGFDPEDPCSTANPYHYHLSFDSVCKDTGNPNHDANDLGLYDLDGEDRFVNSCVDRGADELYSCDGDLSADDIYNSLDWNFDGLVNYIEFAAFGEVWLNRDPNDPGIITDPNFADDPDYADPETLAMLREKWDSFFNLNDTGSSEYMIDTDDLVVIAQDWAWIACWKESQLDILDNMTMAMSMGGGESMAMEVTPMSFGFEALSKEPEPEQIELSTPELVSLVEGIYAIIEYVDTAIEEGHENAENLYEMKDFLEEVLLDLQADR